MVHLHTELPACYNTVYYILVLTLVIKIICQESFYAHAYIAQFYYCPVSLMSCRPAEGGSVLAKGFH